MQIIKQLWILIFIYMLGEGIAHIIPSPLPGNVIGFILLITALKIGILQEKRVSFVSSFLLQNLAILFIPGGVGLIKVLHLFNGNILKIIVIILLSTIITMIVTSLTIVTLERIKK